MQAAVSFVSVKCGRDRFIGVVVRCLTLLGGTDPIQDLRMTWEPVRRNCRYATADAAAPLGGPTAYCPWKIKKKSFGVRRDVKVILT